jgi:hypothetical protein
MVPSLVNFFLFNPPQHEGYSIRNDVDIIRLKTSRGNKIAAMYVDRKATVTILFSHGNAEDLNSCGDFMHQLSSLLNVNVMGYDFSGYGGSTGMCVSDYNRALFRHFVPTKNEIDIETPSCLRVIPRITQRSKLLRGH